MTMVKGSFAWIQLARTRKGSGEARAQLLVSETPSASRLFALMKPGPKPRSPSRSPEGCCSSRIRNAGRRHVDEKCVEEPDYIRLCVGYFIGQKETGDG